MRDLTRAVRRASAAATWALTLAAAATLVAQQPDRSKAPSPGPPPALKLPPIMSRTLSNGVRVRIVEMHETPLVQVNLVILKGALADPPNMYGVAGMTGAMLDEGAGSRSSLDIADAVDYLGAELTTTTSYDSMAVRLSVPSARLRDALVVMADVAQRPTFPAADLDRLKKERLTELLQSRDNAGSIAGVAFPKVLYGSAHRFGTPVNGLASVISQLTPDHLRAFHAAQFRPSNGVLLVVGDVTPDAAMPLLESSFGAWKDTAPPASASAQPAGSAAPPQHGPRKIYVIDRPGAAQTEIRIGWIGAPRSTPDYYPLRVMNTILGGSFTSRLNSNLREEHGYSYGAGSAFQMRRAAGPFMAYAAVQTDKTSESLKEFFKELTAIRTAPPSDELSRARNYLALGFPGDFETTGDLAEQLEALVVFELSEDAVTGFIPKVQAVSANEVERTAREYINPDRFAVVLVGDRKVIEAGVRALNLGPIQPLALDDVFGPTVR